jgi:hypothetical protein
MTRPIETSAVDVTSVLASAVQTRRDAAFGMRMF